MTQPKPSERKPAPSAAPDRKTQSRAPADDRKDVKPKPGQVGDLDRDTEGGQI